MPINSNEIAQRVMTLVGAARLMGYGVTHVACVDAVSVASPGSILAFTAERVLWEPIANAPHCLYPIRLIHLYAEVAEALKDTLEQEGIRWLKANEPLAVAFRLLAKPRTERGNLLEQIGQPGHATKPYLPLDNTTAAVIGQDKEKAVANLEQAWREATIPGAAWKQTLSDYPWLNPLTETGHWLSMAVVPARDYDGLQFKRAAQVTQYGWTPTYGLSQETIDLMGEDLHLKLKDAPATRLRAT